MAPSSPWRLGRAPAPTRRELACSCAMLIVALAGLLSGSPRQQSSGSPAQPPAWRTRTEVVWAFASVTDHDGHLVQDLTRDDFQVFDDSLEQRISLFSAERVPVSLGLLVDVSESMRGRRIEEARLALDRFLKELLHPEDEAFLMAFNHAPRLVAAWVSPPSTLSGRLDAVIPSGGTAIYDALARGAPELAHRKYQRAALVVISDGADTASDKSLSEVRSDIRHSEGFVYALAIQGTNERPSTRVNPEALRAVTDDSGGYTAVIKDVDQLGTETSRIAEELNHQYLIGYDNPRPADGEYHSIRIRVKREGLYVRARRGYIAQKDR